MDLPSDDSLRLIVQTYAAFRAAHGEAIGTPDLVEPNETYFPDAITLSAEGIATLLRRMLSYAPVGNDVPIALTFLEEENAKSGGGCSSGACGSDDAKGGGIRGGVTETADHYVVALNTMDARDPILLTTSLARSIGSVVRLEAGEEESRVDATVRGAEAEVAAAAIGFGILLANGSHVYAKGCGGVRMHQGTHLSLMETAIVLALFVRVHEADPARARSHFQTTQKEAWDDALAWVDSNDAIVAALVDHPESLATGHFTLQSTKGFLSRLFGKKRDRLPSEMEIAMSAHVRPRRVRSADEERRLAEAKALVNEALRAR
jgi:hypothetical protein